ncbi:MAG: arginine--tRNA ligase [Planctomycetota bacterium]
MNPLATLRSRFATALATLTDELADSPAVLKLVEMVLPAKDAKLGDYQANCAMPLGKQLGKPPRDVAADLVAALDVADLCETPEIAGPGFINLRLREDWLVEQLTAASADVDRLGIAATETPRTVVVDFSSPNVAKPMHVGHIRSTVIGAALYRVLGFLGHEVISDNHIGDWGTQFGMIIYGYKHFVDEAALAAAPVAELSRLYKLVNQIGDYQSAKSEKLPALAEKIELARERVEDLKSAEPSGDAKQDKKAAKELRKAEAALSELEKEQADAKAKIADFESDATLAALATDHPAIGARALQETAKLHEGDAENRALWDRFLPKCLEEIEATYQRLGVEFDHTLGESFYQPMLAGVVDDLAAKGLATESEGAICVMPETMGLADNTAPFIVRKKDGAFLYATTDLATIQYRLGEWQPDAILYVVDHRQSLHFEQLFATAKQWGIDSIDTVELTHIAFGTVLGEDGKPYKTRSGSAVGLTGLLDEAVDRARSIADASPMLETDAERQQVAERIGIGAIKYADLAHNRTSDYVFSYEKMLAMNGNAAAYMQFSYARVRGIFAKAGVTPEAIRESGGPIVLNSPAERALGITLLQFAEALDRVAAEYKPNHLTAYLFDLASRYSEFFEHCPVLKAQTDELKQSRLLLCDLVARTIAKGLELLGIQTVERM